MCGGGQGGWMGHTNTRLWPRRLLFVSRVKPKKKKSDVQTLVTLVMYVLTRTQTMMYLTKWPFHNVKYVFLIVTMATNVWFAAHISGLGSYWQTTYPLVDVLVRTFRGRWKHSYMSCWESLEKYLFCSFWYEDWTWTYQEILPELWTSCHCSTTKEMKKEWFDIKLDFKKMSCKSKAVQGWNTVCDVFTVRCNNRGHWPA